MAVAGAGRSGPLHATARIAAAAGQAHFSLPARNRAAAGPALVGCRMVRAVGSCAAMAFFAGNAALAGERVSSGVPGARTIVCRCLAAPRSGGGRPPAGAVQYAAGIVRARLALHRAPLSARPPGAPTRRAHPARPPGAATRPALALDTGL